MKAKEHDIVTVVFKGLLRNGDVFEFSSEEDPLTFRLGMESVLPAFEKAILGMAVEESKTITIPAEEGYGLVHQELILALPRKNFKNKELKVGAVLGMTVEKDGHKHEVPALVTEINDEQVVVDFNHPLAGEDLTYELTVKSIRNEPTSQSDAVC